LIRCFDPQELMRLVHENTDVLDPRSGLACFHLLKLPGGMLPTKFKGAMSLCCSLSSTAVQKLAMEHRMHFDAAELQATVDVLAKAARSANCSVGAVAPLLWGFATLGIRSRPVEQLILSLAKNPVATHVSKRNFGAEVEDDPNDWPDLTTSDTASETTMWAYTENSDKACKDLVTIAWACGRLLQYEHQTTTAFMDTVAAELSKV
jgi:hypothetical protein